jgi:hypothetical protein
MYCCHGMLVILVRSFEDVMHAWTTKYYS